MSKITVESTQFTNVSGEVTYGVRVYDDYGQDYCNLAEAMITDDMQTYAFAKEMGVKGIEFAEDNGAMINGTWYDADELE